MHCESEDEATMDQPGDKARVWTHLMPSGVRVFGMELGR
jgi:hypothetical protein